MRVIVFGATGKTGRQVVAAALAAGHQVTAFGRSVDRLDIDHDDLARARGDALEPGDVIEAVKGHDAAIVCLGSANVKDRTTLSLGTKHVVAAMTESGGRLIVMSAAGVGDSWRQIPRSSRLVFRTMLRNVLADHGRQEAEVEQSNLDWTIVRPGVLKDGPARGAKATNSGRIARISRADVAAFMVAQLGANTYSRAAISITG